MKTYLMAACAALALVGCESNDNDGHRGGVRDSSRSESTTIIEQSSTNSVNSATNNASPGSTSDRSGNAGSEK